MHWRAFHLRSVRWNALPSSSVYQSALYFWSVNWIDMHLKISLKCIALYFCSQKCTLLYKIFHWHAVYHTYVPWRAPQLVLVWQGSLNLTLVHCCALHFVSVHCSLQTLHLFTEVHITFRRSKSRFFCAVKTLVMKFYASKSAKKNTHTKNHIICVNHEEKTVKAVTMHTFLFMHTNLKILHKLRKMLRSRTTVRPWWLETLTNFCVLFPKL